jgi:MFS family permease
VYMLASPVFGSLSDKWPRKYLIAAGVALWSLATGAAALAAGFWTFLFSRALVGVGEAAYATLSPSVLSDFFPPDKRNRVLTIFYVAIPIGSAIGFVLGGIVGAHWGWRAAFLVCGLPGLLAAVSALFMKEPVRGTFDADKGEAATPWPAALKLLAKNREYIFAVLGYTAVTFASGAMADWFPTFLMRVRGISLADADTLVGTSAVVGGLGGTIIGGYLGDKLKGRTRQPYLALSAWSMLLATVFAGAALLAHGKTMIAACMIAAQFFMWFYNAPINAILVNSVPSRLRARAFSLSILAIHLLGDALSPAIVGIVADASSLTRAISIVPVALAVGMGIWMFAWRTLPEQTPA